MCDYIAVVIDLNKVYKYGYGISECCSTCRVFVCKCLAYGVQLPVDGESLSTGDPVIFTKPKISFSDCWKPDIINCAN